jgi:hypothetical protein
VQQQQWQQQQQQYSAAGSLCVKIQRLVCLQKVHAAQALCQVVLVKLDTCTCSSSSSSG